MGISQEQYEVLLNRVKKKSTLPVKTLVKLSQATSAKKTKSILKKAKRGKYNNKILETEDGRFHSQREYEEWKRLKALAKTGAIKNLQRQVNIPLIVNGKKVCSYICDFVYEFRGKVEYVDVKGFRTDVFNLKSKLFTAITGEQIKEVR